MSSVVVSAQSVGKRYTIGHRAVDRAPTLRDALVKGAGRIVRASSDILQGRAVVAGDETEDFWALKDVSFEIQAGDIVGLVGRNGAGKSTLLKILSRITDPSCGRIEIVGRVASLLEVGTGFHQELTGRENIFLNGAILGMSRAEIRGKFDEIVDFAGIDRFLDTPVKRYSNGMYVRLAFAVAAHLDPDVLIVDEVLTVGDADFQRKGLAKIQEAARAGRTVILVSHNMGVTTALCKSVIWLDGGLLRQVGPAAEVTRGYMMETTTLQGQVMSRLGSDAGRSFRVLDVQIRDAGGDVRRTFSCDESISVVIDYFVRRSVPDLRGCMEILREDDVLVMVSDSMDREHNALSALREGHGTIRIRIPERTLSPGDYRVSLNFSGAGALPEEDIDCLGHVAGFSLDDHLTPRGNARGGFFSSRLDWTSDCEV
jgi:lipopolysaccharide transport system ATP-binding protein